MDRGIGGDVICWKTVQFIYRMARAQEQEWVKDQYNQDSNSNFSNSNFLPLSKRDAPKKNTNFENNTETVINQLGYQIVEELTIITPLEVHPSKLCEEVQTYYYQRKLPSVMESDLKKRQERQKVDFITALTSLFRKAFLKSNRKYCLLLPNGGLLYFLAPKQEPILIISTHNHQFSPLLEKEGISCSFLEKQTYQRERIMIEGQYVRLFHGFFLNYVLSKNLNIEIFSNFSFDYSFRQPPMMTQLLEHRPEKEHLRFVQESVVGEKKSKLYHIRLQSMWFKEDIARIEEKIKFYQQDYQRLNKIQTPIQHDLDFKINRFSLGLNEDCLKEQQ